MEYKYENNTNDCNVTYHRTHTGPNFFRVYYKHGALIRFTPKEVGAVFGVARFTPSVNAIRDWCYQMVDKYGSEADKDNPEYLKYIAKHGFGPEAHEDTEDGTKNTKMIV